MNNNKKIKYLEDGIYEGKEIDIILQLLKNGKIKDKYKELPSFFDYIYCFTGCLEDADGHYDENGVTDIELRKIKNIENEVWS